MDPLFYNRRVAVYSSHLLFCRVSEMSFFFFAPHDLSVAVFLKCGGSYRCVCLCVYTFACTHTPLLGVRAPPVSCPLTGAILPVFTHLPPLPLPTVPWTVPCNPEAQCLAATLTTHWTATCCVQSPPPYHHLPCCSTPASPPSSDPKPTPPQLTNPCLASNHISPCSTRLCQTLLFFSDLSTVELSLSLSG